MKIGVYGALSLGLVDIAFSLTRFIAVETGSSSGFASMALICESQFNNLILLKFTFYSTLAMF